MLTSDGAPPFGSMSATRNAVHFGSSVCLVFMAFSVSQNFQTSSDHKAAGATALGILYACFAASNFVSSFIVTTLGSKLCLIIGAITYALFVAANIAFVEAILFASSALIGVGASILWTAQGAYISNCAALHEQALAASDVDARHVQRPLLQHLPYPINSLVICWWPSSSRPTFPRKSSSQ